MIASIFFSAFWFLFFLLLPLPQRTEKLVSFIFIFSGFLTDDNKTYCVWYVYRFVVFMRSVLIMSGWQLREYTFP